MSKSLTWVKRLRRAIALPQQNQHQPDGMSMRDWADLPIHHPCSDERSR
jgi:hypothetical protein